jgi:hypothetical protein
MGLVDWLSTSSIKVLILCMGLSQEFGPYFLIPAFLLALDILFPPCLRKGV